MRALIRSYRRTLQSDRAHLLEQYEFRQATLKETDRRASLAEWVAEQQAQGIVPDIPHWLDEVVCKCLEKNPDNRYPDAYVLQLRLQETPAFAAVRSSQDVSQGSPILRALRDYLSDDIGEILIDKQEFKHDALAFKWAVQTSGQAFDSQYLQVFNNSIGINSSVLSQNSIYTVLLNVTDGVKSGFCF